MKASSSLIIILGTGRCGTVSLTRLLDNQVGWTVEHEPKPVLPWEKDLDLLERKISIWPKSSNYGEAGFYFLPYTRDIIELTDRPPKFVCLKRGKEATVASYIAKTSEDENHPPRNHWKDHDGERWREDLYWNRCYPSYDMDHDSRGPYIRKYYDDYYERAQEYQREYNQFSIFDMDSVLNDHEGQQKLFDFVGIEDPQFWVGVRLNEQAFLRGE